MHALLSMSTFACIGLFSFVLLPFFNVIVKFYSVCMRSFCLLFIHFSLNSSQTNKNDWKEAYIDFFVLSHRQMQQIIIISTTKTKKKKKRNHKLLKPKCTACAVLCRTYGFVAFFLFHSK